MIKHSIKKVINLWSVCSNVNEYLDSILRDLMDEMRDELSCKYGKYVDDFDLAFEMDYGLNRILGKPDKIFGFSVTIYDDPFVSPIEHYIRLTAVERSRLIYNDKIDTYIYSQKMLNGAINNINKTFAEVHKMEKKNKDSMKIKNVIFSNPATIVMWEDGTKTIVRCGEGDTYDPEKGLAMAVTKKALGTNKSQSNYCDILKKWLPKED